MCRPASMIVTKKKVFWSENTDSHHEIISEFKLRETDASGNINIVPIEIYPEDGNLASKKKWKFSIDHAGYSRDLPDWWDTEKYEKECRLALKDWKKQKIISNPCVLKQGQFYVVSSDSATVRASDSATVWASGSATVRASGSATVRAFESATVIAYTVIDPNCLKSKTAVLIDRSTYSKVSVHIGK